MLWCDVIYMKLWCIKTNRFLLHNSNAKLNKAIIDSRLWSGEQLTISIVHTAKHAPLSPAAVESRRQTVSALTGWHAPASLPAEPVGQWWAAAAHAWLTATSTGASELHNAMPVRLPIDPMVWKHDVIHKTKVHNESQCHQRRTEPWSQAKIWQTSASQTHGQTNR